MNVKGWRLSSFLAVFCMLSLMFTSVVMPASAQGILDPNPPAETVKLIFIHHSTGENWLRDDYGGLGQALADNNYFVSDTNYGWGPESIGDRTDIPNWEEWFAGGQTGTIMAAVYTESEQHSEYTRLSDDPGSENMIVMFKSCFPNSALEGSPNDPPSADGGLSVGHAKYVYNQLLPYFAAHPEKLFIVITAPPLSDGTYAKNARAFNNWLVNDWLEANQYTQANVAVFDFYNVLTHKEAHHWYADGEIQHITQNKNVLAYPSGDDHPNVRGSQKATEEFIPLLNIFYNRWVAGGGGQGGTGSSGGGSGTTTGGADNGSTGSGSTSGGDETGQTSGVPLPPEVVLAIDDFESGAGWEAFRDETTASTVTCYADQGSGPDGSASLLMDYSITSGSWGTCALFFDTPQDWSEGTFLSFDVHSTEPGLPFSVAVYTGTQDERQTYHMYRNTSTSYTDGYVEYTAAWDELVRPDWEENAGSALGAPTQVLGLSFGVDGSGDGINSGVIHFDNVTVKDLPDYGGTGNSGDEDETTGEDASTGEEDSGRSLPCLGSALLPLILIGFTMLIRKR